MLTGCTECFRHEMQLTFVSRGPRAISSLAHGETERPESYQYFAHQSDSTSLGLGNQRFSSITRNTFLPNYVAPSLAGLTESLQKTSTPTKANITHAMRELSIKSYNLVTALSNFSRAGIRVFPVCTATQVPTSAGRLFSKRYDMNSYDTVVPDILSRKGRPKTD